MFKRDSVKGGCQFPPLCKHLTRLWCIINILWFTSVFLWWLFFLVIVYCISIHQFSDVTTMEYRGFPKQSMVVWYPLLKLSSTTRFSGNIVWLKLNMMLYTFSFLPTMFICNRVLYLWSYTLQTCSKHCQNNTLKKSEQATLGLPMTCYWLQPLFIGCKEN